MAKMVVVRRPRRKPVKAGSTRGRHGGLPTGKMVVIAKNVMEDKTHE